MTRNVTQGQRPCKLTAIRPATAPARLPPDDCSSRAGRRRSRSRTARTAAGRARSSAEPRASRGARRAGAVREHAAQQVRPDPRAAVPGSTARLLMCSSSRMSRRNRSRRLAARRSSRCRSRTRRVVELGEVHLAGPRVGERACSIARMSSISDGDDRGSIMQLAMGSRCADVRGAARRPACGRRAGAPRRYRPPSSRAPRPPSADRASDRHRRGQPRWQPIRTGTTLAKRTAPSPAKIADCDRHRRPIPPACATVRRRPAHRARRAVGREQRRLGDAVERAEHVAAMRVDPAGDKRPGAGHRLAGCANASSAETATIGLLCTNARPCIVAIPMRRPVNEPGPLATANRCPPGDGAPSAARSPGSRSACVRDASPRARDDCPSSTSATLPARPSYPGPERMRYT